MKKSELRNIIKEEIQNIMSEDDNYIVDPSNMTDDQFDSFINLKTLATHILPTLDSDEAELYIDRYGLNRDFDGFNYVIKDNLGCRGVGKTALDALKNWADEFIYAFEDQLNENIGRTNKIKKSELQKLIREVITEVGKDSIHTAKFDGCVKAVSAKQPDVNAYPICMASLGKEKAIKKSHLRESVSDIPSVNNFIQKIHGWIDSEIYDDQVVDVLWAIAMEYGNGIVPELNRVIKDIYDAHRKEMIDTNQD